MEDTLTAPAPAVATAESRRAYEARAARGDSQLRINENTIREKLAELAAGRLTFPPSRRLRFTDERLPGFGMNLYPKGRVSFWVQRGGKAPVTLDSPYSADGTGGVTTKQARTWAEGVLGDIARGDLGLMSRITLKEAMDLYISRMVKKGRAESSIEDVRQCIGDHLSDWLKRPLTELDEKTVISRHDSLSKRRRDPQTKRDVGGKAAADKTFGYLGSIYGNAKRREKLPDNPCAAIDYNGGKRKASPPPNLREWCVKIADLFNPVLRDLQLFTLMTGLRREDAASIRWEFVDFERGTLHRPEPKGGEKKAFTIPLSRTALAILKHRQADNETWHAGSPWAFPAESGSGRIVETRGPRSEEDRIPSLHRLRDAYLSVAEECSVPKLVQKLLVNHGFKDQSDVTDGYKALGGDFLRQAQERITAEMLRRTDLLSVLRAKLASVESKIDAADEESKLPVIELTGLISALSGNPATVDDAAAELASWATV